MPPILEANSVEERPARSSVLSRLSRRARQGMMAVSLVLAAHLPVHTASGQLFVPDTLRLRDADVPRLAAMLRLWGADARALRPQVGDPLAEHQRRSGHPLAPPGARYDAACSLVASGLVFTLGTELSRAEALEELADLRLTARRMRGDQIDTVGLRARGSSSVPGVDMSKLPGAFAAMADLMANVKGAMAREMPARATGGAAARARVTTLRWYGANGYHVGDSTSLEIADFAKAGIDAVRESEQTGEADSVTVYERRSTMLVERALFCAHLPRGPVIRVVVGWSGPETAENRPADGAAMQRRFARYYLASMFDGGEPEGAGSGMRAGFEQALEQNGLTRNDLERMILAVETAEWLAGVPAIMDALVASHRRTGDPLGEAIPVALDNVAWFRRHRTVLAPALDEWRRSFAP